MKDRIPVFLLSYHKSLADTGRARLRRSFIDRAVTQIGAIVRMTMLQWDLASRKGLLQSVDGRAKLVGMLFLIVVASVKREIVPEAFLAIALFALAALSRLDLAPFYKRVGVLAFVFGFLAVLPATCNAITEGRIIFPLVRLSKAYHFWIYTIPREIGITREGLNIAGLVTLRIANSVCACLLLFSTTPLPEILRSLKIFRVPDTVILVLILTHKYIFVFSTMLEEAYLAKKSRLAGPLKSRDAGEWTAGRAAFLFKKTGRKCDDVYAAMVSRGMQGEIRMAPLRPLRAADYIMGLVILCVGGTVAWM
jgi:cobalt/nickel transport system permease protein